MEEAYTALYQEFLRLRSLCLKQATMLQHLAETLRIQQGDFVTSDLLTRGMDQIQLNQPISSQAEKSEPPTPLNPADHNGTSTASNILEELRVVEQQGVAHSALRERKPWSSSSFLDSEWMSATGGRFMSSVTLQSQVCEFCQAVFPGHTTTKGEYLHHLTSHIT
uniref:Uncharacterized protein n=1 Tax=Denticeps clupeoides TaxID=299321 RepID=A0AAY3ZXD2_9TELE